MKAIVKDFHAIVDSGGVKFLVDVLHVLKNTKLSKLRFFKSPPFHSYRWPDTNFPVQNFVAIKPYAKELPFLQMVAIDLAATTLDDMLYVIAVCLYPFALLRGA